MVLLGMATHRTSLDVSLRPELERFIAERAAWGRFQSASGVVRAAVPPQSMTGA